MLRDKVTQSKEKAAPRPPQEMQEACRTAALVACAVVVDTLNNACANAAALKEETPLPHFPCTRQHLPRAFTCVAESEGGAFVTAFTVARTRTMKRQPAADASNAKKKPFQILFRPLARVVTRGFCAYCYDVHVKRDSDS